MISLSFTPQQDEQEVLALRPWSTPHLQRLDNAAGGTEKEIVSVESGLDDGPS